ncbi:phospholipid ABC transporter ATP-binding protein MlaF, partial [Acinetobacter variabilis]
MKTQTAFETQSLREVKCFRFKRFERVIYENVSL